MPKKILILSLILLALAGCGAKIANLPINNKNMKITSSAFTANSNLPAKYTCDGQAVNPPLSISEIPAGAKSLALIVSDPDAPSGNFIHWLVWNIDPQIAEIEENSIPNGAVLGNTSLGKPGYVAPCPPQGVHRYTFTIYALDEMISLEASADNNALQKALHGHILDSAQIIGLYQQ